MFLIEQNCFLSGYYVFIKQSQIFINFNFSRIILPMHKEKRSRSVAKAVTYRLVSIVMDSTIAYAITRDTQQTAMLVIISNVISIMVYFIHERAWNRIHWGKHSLENSQDGKK